MGQDIGRDGGITSLWDLPNAPGSAKKFTARLYVASQSLSANLRNRGGRGDGNNPEQAFATNGGIIVASGTIRLDGWPRPSDFVGQQGNVVVTFGKAADGTTPITDTGAVQVTAFGFKHNEKQQNSYDVTITARYTSLPTLAGFPGSQPTADAPPGSGSKELWEGLGKSIDPNAILSGASQSFDVWGVVDDDTHEVAAIAAAISAPISPVSGLKLKYAGFKRICALAVVINFVWAPNDSADDLINPRTQTATDPSDLQSRQTIAAVFNNSSPPSPPATPSGLVLSDTIDDRITPNVTARQWIYAKDTNQGRMEKESTSVLTDPNGLESVATTAALDGTPSVPSGMSSVGTETRPQVPGHTLTLVHSRDRSSIGNVEMPNSFVNTDPKGVDVRQDITTVYTTLSGPPSDPTPGTHQKIRMKTTQVLSNTKSKITVRLDGVNEQDLIELPHNKTITDPAANPLNSSQFLASMYVTTSGPPSDPTPASGFKIVETTDLPVENNAFLQVRIWRIATKDSNDEAIFEHRRNVTDPAALKSAFWDAAVFTTGTPPSDITPPSGQKITLKTDLPLNITYSVRIWQCGLNDAQDEIERPGTLSTIQAESRLLFRAHVNQRATKTVINCISGDTADSLAQAAYDAVARGASADRTVYDASVRKISPLKAEQTITRGILLRQFQGQPTGGLIPVIARWSGTAVQVWVDEVITRGGQWHALINHQYIYQTRYRFQLHQTVLTTVSQQIDPKFAYEQTSNNASFVGFGTQTVVFLGRAILSYNMDFIGDGKGAYAVPVIDTFEYRSGGVINESGIRPGWRMVNSAPTPQAWNTVSLFGFPAALAPSADFTIGFLT